jgi:hypothetical protein
MKKSKHHFIESYRNSDCTIAGPRAQQERADATYFLNFVVLRVSEWSSKHIYEKVDDQIKVAQQGHYNNKPFHGFDFCV